MEAKFLRSQLLTCYKVLDTRTTQRSRLLLSCFQRNEK